MVDRSARQPRHASRVNAVYASLKSGREGPRLTTVGHEAHNCRFIDVDLEWQWDVW